MLYCLSFAPMGVILGSSRSLNRGPWPSLRSCSDGSIASAPTSMVRNLSIGKDVPPLPTRSCWKKTGPLWSRRISRATTANSGDKKVSRAAAAHRSMAVLTACCGPANTGASTWSKDKPATGRVSTRGPATSVSPGTTTRSTFWLSSAQARRRSPPASNLADEVRATVWTPIRRATSAASLSSPQNRDPADVALGGIAAAGGHDVVSGFGDRVQRRDEVRQVVAIDDDQN